ncbi:hypothetical protein BN1723_004957, partial [Verticillium longisporum]
MGMGAEPQSQVKVHSRAHCTLEAMVEWSGPEVGLDGWMDVSRRTSKSERATGRGPGLCRRGKDEEEGGT